MSTQMIQPYEPQQCDFIRLEERYASNGESGDDADCAHAINSPSLWSPYGMWRISDPDHIADGPDRCIHKVMTNPIGPHMDREAEVPFSGFHKVGRRSPGRDCSRLSVTGLPLSLSHSMANGQFRAPRQLFEPTRLLRQAIFGMRPKKSSWSLNN